MMKKIYLILCLIVAINAVPNPEILAKNHAKYYKKELPYRTSNNLILTDLLAVGESLIYRYTLNDTMKNAVSKMSEDEQVEYIKVLEKYAIKSSCNDRYILNMLNSGVYIEHLFYYEMTRLLFEIKIDARKCAELN